mmetsp:Transcript_158614/g.280128  ORF Transcript_158614/g.280128 Transcript_158614/m.280128 type:complete len:328 (-) Transcript_158614:40-1023(-)
MIASISDHAVNVDLVIDTLLDFRNVQPVEGTQMMMLNQATLEYLCMMVRQIFADQPMLLEVDAPMKVCGDIHGQYFDLLRHFEYSGSPKEGNYLFLGDYVDRGLNSIETIVLLFAFKVKYPENFFMLRGNHECAAINRIYGFYDECKRRYNVKLWKTFGDCFNYMPVCAKIEDNILCMHGGLSPDMELDDALEKIRQLSRPAGPVPDSGLLCDLLWSDPASNVEGFDWGPSDRGISYTFGADTVRRFCEMHELDLIIRAHQVVEDGYEFFAGRRLVTVFSAPNYCREFDNCGALMTVDKNLVCSFSVLKPSPPTANLAKRSRLSDKL